MPRRFMELPYELITATFDYLCPLDIIQVSHLCTECRTIAQAHPTFWRDIRLYSTSAHAMEFFTTRIDSNDGPGLRMTLDLASLEEGSTQASVILRAIDRNLFRTARLRLCLSDSLAKVLFNVLQQPAPLLGDLTLLFLGGRAAALPLRIFNGQCSVLLRLRLDGCTLPQVPLASFASVERLTFTTSRPTFVPTDLFEYFPALRELDLTAECGIGNLAGLCAQFQGRNQLQTMTLRIPRSDAEVLFSRCPALLVTPVIELLRNSGPARLLITELPGPLGIELGGTPGALRYTVRSLSRGWRRTFAIPRNRLKVWPSNSFYASDAVRDRVVTLSLDLLTYNEHVLGALPACATLRITLGGRGAEVHIGRPVELPELRRVELRAGDEFPVDLDAGALVRFVVSLVGERTPAVALHLEGLSVMGDPAVLMQAGFMWTAAQSQ